MGCANIKICIMLVCLVFGHCTFFCKGESSANTMHIMIIDRSRIDNLRVRHVFREFFLKNIVDHGRNWLVVYDEPGDNREKHPELIQYCVIIDIMEYCPADIEKNISRMLASVRIIDQPENSIIAVHIAGTKSSTIEGLCQKPAWQLARDVVKELAALKRAQGKISDTATEKTNLP